MGGELDYQYEILKQRQRGVLTFYLARGEYGFVRVVVNQARGHLMLSGRGVWFSGKQIN